MSQLEVGQRFRVFEILPGNDYAMIKGQEIKVGQQRIENFDEISGKGVWINSIFGNTYHYPADNKLKHIGTLVITRVKERNSE